MVVDTLDNLEKYVSLNPLFADVVKFIKENDLSKLEDGKHFIKESNLFVNITTAHGKSEEDAVLETHRKMIDIQIPLDNEETYGYTPLADLPEVEYNEAKDVTKYPGVKAQMLVTSSQVSLLSSGHKMVISHASVVVISTRLSSRLRIKEEIFKIKLKKNNIE
jgi:YhcH/YjgK/YiaL family protein